MSRRVPTTPALSAYSSVLADGIRRFLSTFRALGRLYAAHGYVLRLLDRYLVERHIASAAEITPAFIDAFLASRGRTGPRSFNSLLLIVRRFFAWLVTQRLLDASPVRARSRREVQGRLPYIFNAAQARQLLAVAARLPDAPHNKLRGPTFHAIFALLYGLGLRVSEAAHLVVGDIDFGRDVLTVRAAKFGKTRLVPFGPRMASMLRAYLETRHGPVGTTSPSASLFSFKRSGTPVSTNTIRNVFRAHVLPALHIQCPKGTTRPRVHDLRHSFAVGTLLRWYRAGIAPADRLERLSIFLGHQRPEYTAVYLTVTAELLAEASGRFARYARPTLHLDDDR